MKPWWIWQEPLAHIDLIELTIRMKRPSLNAWNKYIKRPLRFLSIIWKSVYPAFVFTVIHVLFHSCHSSCVVVVFRRSNGTQETRLTTEPNGSRLSIHSAAFRQSSLPSQLLPRSVDLEPTPATHSSDEDEEASSDDDDLQLSGAVVRRRSTGASARDDSSSFWEQVFEIHFVVVLTVDWSGLVGSKFDLCLKTSKKGSAGKQKVQQSQNSWRTLDRREVLTRDWLQRELPTITAWTASTISCENRSLTFGWWW